MSMLSAQCDRLRAIADDLCGMDYDSYASDVRDAADTILQLRNDCVVLRDERMELRDENDKLRELVRDMFEEIEAGGFDPMVERQGKSSIYYEEDPSWRVGIRERIRELGIEVGE